MCVGGGKEQRGEEEENFGLHSDRIFLGTCRQPHAPQASQHVNKYLVRFLGATESVYPP